MLPLLESVIATGGNPEAWSRVTTILLSAASIHAVSERLVSFLNHDSRPYHDWSITSVFGSIFFQKLPVSVQFLRGRFFYSIVCFGSLIAAIAAFTQSIIGQGYVAWLAIYLCGHVYLKLQNGLGVDGSFHMMFIIGSSVVLAATPGLTKFQHDLFVWFVCCQAVLSYFLAGFCKLFGESWRNGEAIFLVMGSRSYGTHWMYNWLAAAPVTRKVLTYAVIAFELSFPLVLWLPQGGLAGLLVVAASFHFATSFLMGLGNFVMAFIASYPAIVYCWSLMREPSSFATP